MARDEVKITLRAIRLRPLASIPQALVFDPAQVVLTVASTSTNVLNGVVQPDGTQPVVTPTTIALALDTAGLANVRRTGDHDRDGLSGAAQRHAGSGPVFRRRDPNRHRHG